jgi:aminoglycoside phosphotransferase (APT) family kinase protein
VVEPKGPLLARGRDSGIYEHGPGRVLRRLPAGRSASTEAAVMVDVLRRGFPAPRVHEVDGPDMVMERLDGPTMLHDLERHPWRLLAHARVLADLHRRLHRLSAPDGLSLPDTGTGDRLVHLDLHPMNVLLTSRGPVVIDWTNASRGASGLDVADAWVVMRHAELDGPAPLRAVLEPFRRAFAAAFRRAADDPVDEWIAVATTRRLSDPNLRPNEKAALRKVLSERREVAS